MWIIVIHFQHTDTFIRLLLVVIDGVSDSDGNDAVGISIIIRSSLLLGLACVLAFQFAFFLLKLVFYLIG